ncbi:MAG: UGSC family (seleno)protein [Actinomycetota bacterium]
MPNAILDPTGRSHEARQATAELAPRRPDLKGARIGLLDNTKHNAALLLREIGKLLVSEHGAAEVTEVQTKKVFSLPVPDDVVTTYVRECDAVVTGVGDCGSCSAASTADGIVFERSGLPAAVICTDAFVVTANKMAEMRGAPDYSYVVTEHPVAVLTEEQVRQRAEKLLPEVVSLLTEPPGDAQ